MSTITSTPVRDLPIEMVCKLADRYGVPVDVIRGKHYIALSDIPNIGEVMRKTEKRPSVVPEDFRTVTSVLLLDAPASMEISSMGTSVKSPGDGFDADRGVEIAFARAIKATNTPGVSFTAGI